MAEETKLQNMEDEATAKSVATDKVKDKLEDAATTLIEHASDQKTPWYKKALLYVGAVILGGCAFLFANFGDTIMAIIEKWLNGLAQ